MSKYKITGLLLILSFFLLLPFAQSQCKWSDLRADIASEHGPALSAYFHSLPKEGRLEVWEEVFVRNLPDSWRVNPDFLKPFGKALDEKPIIELHLHGHISPQGNAVGCHLTSAIDNVNVKLRDPQPSGFPTYFDEPANTVLKEAYIDIKDANGAWQPKQNKSSFFPNGWNEDKVLEEIAFVRSNPANKVNDRTWVGLASDGTEIEVRYTGADINNLTFSTVFPTN